MSARANSVGSNNCNEDLRNERRKCKFNVEELTYFLDGGEKKTKERRDREQDFLTDPALNYTTPTDFLSHEDRYNVACQKVTAVFKKIKELTNDGSDVDEYSDSNSAAPKWEYAAKLRAVLGSNIGSAILRDGNPFGVHWVMFIPTLLGQGTPEQQAKWLTRAWNGSIIGTYAQTEMGHGTNIRALECTATYDPKTEEFVLNSPTLSSYKWWPGGLGKTANYAVVMAQLYTQGTCYGIHPFVVQLRDEETHRALPGIKIGEIGTKLGMHTVDNGYLGFKSYRIPRTNLLMKHAQVLKDGTYMRAPSDKLRYGTMVFVRVIICQDAAQNLMKACTIAIRYSAVRRQSELKPGEREPQIMDYQTQQFKLFPPLAACFAHKFAADALWNTYNNVTHSMEDGNLEQLPELHALSCGLKALSTHESAFGVENLRLSCGGHGYMTCSNFTRIYGFTTAAVTYEGENTVLLLQVARYLLKSYRSAAQGETVRNSVAYLRPVSAASSRKRSGAAGLLEDYQAVASCHIKQAATQIDELISRGSAPEDAWNMTSIKLVAAAEAHCRYFVVDKFVESVEKAEVSNTLKSILDALCELYAVFWVLEKAGDFLRFSHLTTSDIDALNRRLFALLAEIRPNAVGIVDGFDLCDEVINSVLGAWDGRVYERLFEFSQQSPLNKTDVPKAFELYLKPFMKSNL